MYHAHSLLVVVDPCKSHIKTFEFLNLPILKLSTLEQYVTTATNKIRVPFFVSLPSELGGTYTDKKGSIQYYLYRYGMFHINEQLFSKSVTFWVY